MDPNAILTSGHRFSLEPSEHRLSLEEVAALRAQLDEYQESDRVYIELFNALGESLTRIDKANLTLNEHRKAVKIMLEMVGIL